MGRLHGDWCYFLLAPTAIPGSTCRQRKNIYYYNKNWSFWVETLWNCQNFNWIECRYKKLLLPWNWAESKEVHIQDKAWRACFSLTFCSVCCCSQNPFVTGKNYKLHASKLHVENDKFWRQFGWIAMDKIHTAIHDYSKWCLSVFLIDLLTSLYCVNC